MIQWARLISHDLTCTLFVPIMCVGCAMCVFVVDVLVYGMVLTDVGTLAAMGRVAGHAGCASRSPRSLMAICSSLPANPDARHTSADLDNFLTI